MNRCWAIRNGFGEIVFQRVKKILDDMMVEIFFGV
jgi:hypothetical protein